MVYIDITLQVRDNGNNTVDIEAYYTVFSGDAVMKEYERGFLEVSVHDGFNMAQAARSRYLAIWRAKLNEPNDSDDQLELPF